MSNAAILPCPTQDVLGKNPIFWNSNDGGVLVLMALNVSITKLLNVITIVSNQNKLYQLSVFKNNEIQYSLENYRYSRIQTKACRSINSAQLTFTNIFTEWLFYQSHVFFDPPSQMSGRSFLFYTTITGTRVPSLTHPCIRALRRLLYNIKYICKRRLS